ncbi:MAG: methionine synthase [Deltaproteobacteria bacterium]|nr:methionine synthase [Deltaproteobacteria bacterium]
MKDKLIEAFISMKESETLEIVREMLDANVSPINVLKGCNEALEKIGERFEAEQAFIPELIMSGRIMERISDILKSKYKNEEPKEKLGKVLIGTVAGDIHHIGKNIVNFMLDANGFEVIDLGVDVSVETFVEKIKEHQPQIIGLSALLTLGLKPMKETIKAIEAAGLRNGRKIMIGGGPVDDRVREVTGADAFGRDAVAAVKLTKTWIGERI